MARAKSRRRAGTWEHGGWHVPPPSRDELRCGLAPLLRQLRRVDDAVAKLAGGEGRVDDLVQLQRILTERFPVGEPTCTTVTLAQPEPLREQLRLLSRDLHLEIHAVDGQYPCYLLCRVAARWDAPDIILEELHVSSGRVSFFHDRRFAMLMRHGRSRTFLRLARWRRASKTLLGGVWRQRPDDRDCDDLLAAVARLVLASAWYEDQRLPFAVADAFGLTHFRSALELVAFILGSNLYQVAAGIREWQEELVGFFQQVYPNVPLAALLHNLSRHGAVNPAQLETAARGVFVELNRLFSAFLGTTGALADLEQLELFKVVLGCFANLGEVAARACWKPALEEAVGVLEGAAADATGRLVG
ncbi:MAG: hypothetical protein JXQ71_06350 [Verrucomicrobia bacterium]|nr:hypothetical protein [Verrucomicrobiota bacterium]